MFTEDKPYRYVQQYLRSSNPQPLYISQPFLNYINNPAYTDNSGHHQINTWGLRHPRDIIIPKPPNVTRVLFLGGSTTFGEVEKTEHTFPFLLERRFNDTVRNPNKHNRNIECINAGLGAATSAELLVHYLLKYKYLHPDVVVIHAGINDAFTTVSLPGYIYQPDYHTAKVVFKNPLPVNNTSRIFSYSNILTFMLTKTRYKEYLNNSFTENPFFSYHDDHVWYPGGNEEKFKPTANGYYNNLTELVKILQSHGCKILLVTEVVDTIQMPATFKNLLYEGILINNEYTIRVGNERSVPVCILPKSSFPDSLFIPNDGIHVNEIGEKVKADLIEPYLHQILHKPVANGLH
ncbi:MAG: SGNH/GDSL hydrolase family protein [Chitinophagales bacterium]|nr:SGNH/GDSL hydrolase family protein [Chitinophagales bacterium]MDW8417795.1 SGNH/GDSL hydrolase family protein [Chitinophagales bacterium]